MLLALHLCSFLIFLGYVLIPSFVDFVYEQMGLRAKANMFC